MSDEVTGRLENWAFFGKALCGQIYDDKKGRWPDGHAVKFVKVAACRLREGGVIKTRNSSYLLGKEAGV